MIDKPNASFLLLFLAQNMALRDYNLLCFIDFFGVLINDFETSFKIKEFTLLCKILLFFKISKPFPDARVDLSHLWER